MKKADKLNVLLAITDQLRNSYKRSIANYIKYFSKSQGAFKGEKRTYTPKENTIDDPSKRGVVLVQTTIKEKVDYFIETSGPFIDALFSQEKTNASNKAKAELIVENKSWGEYTSLELLRLKSLLESSDLGDFSGVLNAIPVRSDSEVWNKTNDEDYSDREIYQTALFTGVAKTTIKNPYILVDPNLKGKDYPPNYQPAVASRDEVLELGDYTQQKFSGEWSQREKAASLHRTHVLLTAITKALKEANDCEIEKSELTANKIFNYIFYNK
jgi:hypothetical protein